MHQKSSYAMLIRHVVVEIVAVLLLATIAFVVQGSPPAAEAGTSGARWGLAVAKAAQDPGALQKAMGRPFGSRGIYYPLSGFRYPSTDAREARSDRALIYININSWHLVSGKKVCYPWRYVAAGNYDKFLGQWVQSLKSFGYGRTIITFHHEPSITTNPNQPHCGTPDDYVAAFHHVFVYFRQHGISYPFVWTMMASDFNLHRAGRYRPPLKNFQIVGVDGFNKRSLRWRWPAEIFNAVEAYSRSVGKRLLIGEVGSEEDLTQSGRKAKWITAASSVFRDYGNVVAVEWTDVRGYRPTTSLLSLQAWVQASELPYYS
jgi:hypothetical protein